MTEKTINYYAYERFAGRLLPHVFDTEEGRAAYCEENKKATPTDSELEFVACLIFYGGVCQHRHGREEMLWMDRDLLEQLIR